MFKKQNTAWPSTANDRLVDNDPMIIKVPMDEVEWGARKSTMAKVRGSDGFKERSMNIKHVK